MSELHTRPWFTYPRPRKPPVNHPRPSWMTPDMARRLITHGDRLWAKNPRKKEVIWREGDYFYRLSGTSFRLLLDYRRVRSREWSRSYCRWL